MQKYSHQIITSISFGLTSAVIVALGMIVGLNAATSSKLAVIAGIIILALTDGLADAAGLHMAEEAETEKGKAKHSKKEIWLTTLFAFLSVSGFTLTFTIPFLIFALRTAVIVSIAWGIILLAVLNFNISKIRKEKPSKLIFSHILLAFFVIFVSYFLGNLIRALVK